MKILLIWKYCMIKDKDPIENVREQIALLYLFKSSTSKHLSELSPYQDTRDTLVSRTGKGAHPGLVTVPCQCDGGQAWCMVSLYTRSRFFSVYI